jgi:CDP-diacylglycerol---serine O-phosphatidyltransferase
MKITRAVVPSLFTTLNIFCGFLAILSTNQGQFHNAAWFIILAAIFDSLDGVMARITKSSSQFGVELDSLADVVSFGAAPSFLVYQAHLYTLENWGIMIAALPVIFGAIRLARFNVQLVGFDKDYFNGLPIPMQAITVCAYILQYYGSGGIGLIGWMGTGLTFLVILLSFLMVSHVKYDTMPKLSRKQIKAHPWKVVGSLIGVLIVVFSKGTLLFLMLGLYIVFGIVRYVFLGVKRTFNKTEDEPVETGEFSSIDI